MVRRAQASGGGFGWIIDGAGTGGGEVGAIALRDPTNAALSLDSRVVPVDIGHIDAPSPLDQDSNAQELVVGALRISTELVVHVSTVPNARTTSRRERNEVAFRSPSIRPTTG
jgi:hypothetical protein